MTNFQVQKMKKNGFFTVIMVDKDGKGRKRPLTVWDAFEGYGIFMLF